LLASQFANQRGVGLWILGPFGARGVGEPGLVSTAPAIANAVYDAIGVSIKDLPFSPEKIPAALKEKNGKE
jgi:CO/xanthine dehydrogenase Mo-binding subunit